MMEAIVSAAITAVCALIGVVLSVRSQSSKTRTAGLAQHEEQNAKLDQMLANQKRLETKVDDNREVAANGIADLKGRVEGMMTVTDTLFGMIVEVDKKVTKPTNRKSVGGPTVSDGNIAPVSGGIRTHV